MKCEKCKTKNALLRKNGQPDFTLVWDSWVSDYKRCLFCKECRKDFEAKKREKAKEQRKLEKELGKEITSDHFATFPQALVELPIKFGTKEGEIVLDPFMGSGTTAVVAKKLNRNYIGIELNKDYIKIAEARLKAMPDTLF